MFYKGRLRVAGDEGDGIPVDLSLDDVYVDLRAAGGDELGRWRMDVVEVARLEGSDFRLLLDGEDMVFRASDPLGFAYNAVTTIEEIATRLRKRRRGLFRRRSDTPQILRGADPEAEEESPRPATDVTAERLADLQSLLPPDGEVDRPPVDDDLFSEFAVDVEEDVAAVSYADDESLIDASAGAEEAVEAFEPDVSEEPGDEQPPADDGESVLFDSEIGAGEHDADDEDHPLEPREAIPGSPGTGDEPVPHDTADVGQATVPFGSGDGESDDSRSMEDLYEPDAVEPVGHESFEPSDLTPPDAPPLDAEPAEPQADDVEPLEPAREDAVDDVAEFEPAVDPDIPESEPGPAEEGPAAPASTASTRQEAGRRRRLFGRSRIDPEHDHQYDESRTVGGITRRVCAICGHVSFAGEDLYEEWK